jgi:hypothetical protein
MTSGTIRIRAFEARDRDEVIALWRSCDLLRSWNDPQKDIDRKLRVRPNMFLVAVDDEIVVGSVMAG